MPAWPMGSDAVLTVSGPGVTVRVNPLDAVVFTLSVKVTVKEYDPAVVTVPLSVLLAKLVPGGADPLRLKVSGGTPPVAAKVALNGEPAWTLLNAAVVITRGAATMVTEAVP